MYVTTSQEVSRQHREENGLEAVMERQTKMVREDREPRPYVVRDLSWELARYLDAESF
jgi:hypothetical protein